MLELRINGFGGQGSVTLAHLLAQAALENGEHGQALPFFGVERRERRYVRRCACPPPLYTLTVNVSCPILW